MSLLEREKVSVNCKEAKPIFLLFPEFYSLMLTTEVLKASFCLSLLLPSSALLGSLMQDGDLYSISVSCLIKKRAHPELFGDGFRTNTQEMGIAAKGSTQASTEVSAGQDPFLCRLLQGKEKAKQLCKGQSYRNV